MLKKVSEMHTKDFHQNTFFRERSGGCEQRARSEPISGPNCARPLSLSLATISSATDCVNLGISS